ncbi:MAG: TonB-dependent receptor [Vicinamibacterales bacterium]
MFRRLLTVAMLVSFAAGSVMAQGRQSGALSGRVTSTDGQPLPGATVTVTSASLQGERSAVADVNGVYRVAVLPPGDYIVKFEMSGMSSVERRTAISLGSDITMDQQLALTPVREVVDVRGGKPAPVASPTGAFNLRASETAVLPSGRTPFFIAELASGLTDNTPNSNQVTVGGGFAYDNVFLMNGVDINDNVLGQPNALFIEEAIEEVQVLSSGVSAEYGRFGGGVVNVITRSGGNALSGAFRLNLTNPAWSVETPFETSRHVTRASKVSPTYEATVGGPIVRDRLWYFGGARIERTTTQSAFAQTGTAFTSRNENTRYEAKLTGTPSAGHTVQGSFIDNATDLRQPALPISIDPATFTTPSTPNRLFAASWRGVLGPRTFATAQYSQKWWTLENAGGTSTAIVDSPFLTRGILGVPGGLQYNAPYWDSTDPEQRNNRQVTASVSQMLSSPRWGSHEVKGGFEHFVSTRVGGNSQTSTGYVFQTDYKLDASSRPALDADGRLIPRFVPGNSRVQVWLPQRGATIDIGTTSLFVNDHWTATPRLTVDLGLRFESVGSEATGGIESVSAKTLVPRLGAAYDLTGDGDTVLLASYGHYAGKYNDVQFSRNTNVGNPDRYIGQYIGPAGEGRTFAAGFDPNNYVAIGGTFPTANVFFDEDLRSPLTREFTLGLAREFKHGWGRATYVRRHATDFVEDFITIDAGTTTIDRNGLFGVFDNAIYRNTDHAERRYQGLDVQSSYRVRSNLTVNGQWTIQIENHGNFEGEAANNPALPSLIGDYPEIFVADRSFPDGRLDDFQRHKVRAWAAYGLDFHQFGRLDIVPLYRFNSARTFSLVAGAVALSPQQVAANPGYVRLPTSQPIYFGGRGSQSFKGAQLFDLAVTYGVPVWHSVRPWIKLEVLNLLNNQDLLSWDTTVAANNAGSKDAYGLPLDYTRGPNFGLGTSNANYARPRQGMDGGRTFLLAAGVRF